MSGRICIKLSMSGWLPLAGTESSWAGINPTWLTWWGHLSRIRILIQVYWFQADLIIHFFKGRVWGLEGNGGPAGVPGHDGQHQSQALVQAHGESSSQPWGPSFVRFQTKNLQRGVNRAAALIKDSRWQTSAACDTPKFYADKSKTTVRNLLLAELHPVCAVKIGLV